MLAFDLFNSKKNLLKLLIFSNIMSSDHKERFIRKGLACVNTEINNRPSIVKSLLLVILLRVSLAKNLLLNSRMAC
jgi:hypothetical protein